MTSSTVQPNEVVEGWAVSPLLELCNVIRGVSYKKGEAETAPGTVTVSQPKRGIDFLLEKCSGVHALGDLPEAFNPTRFFPSHKIANASLPIPLLTGSTTVNVIAVANAASIALPPFLSICKPA